MYTCFVYINITSKREIIHVKFLFSHFCHLCYLFVCFKGFKGVFVEIKSR